MKKMNNYEAPVAEMIELNVNKDFMQQGAGVGGPTMGETSEPSGTWS
jgi:hypothetical protein